MKNAITGKVTYLPEPDFEIFSTETEGSCPGRNISVDENEDEYMLNSQAYIKDNTIFVEDPTSSRDTRSTVLLYATMENKKPVYGTGFLIRSNVVLTAGHCIFDKEYSKDGWVTSAEITPAKQYTGDLAPYGSAHAIAYICGGDWARKSDYDDDWGIIILDKDIGNDTGWFGLRWQSASYDGTQVMTNGYVFRYGQYHGEGTISSSKAKTLESTNIYVSHGMSGGPCYIYTKDRDYQAIGIISNYTSADPEGKLHITSVFRRIDQKLYNELLSYCDEYAS